MSLKLTLAEVRIRPTSELMSRSEIGGVGQTVRVGGRTIVGYGRLGRVEFLFRIQGFRV